LNIREILLIFANPILWTAVTAWFAAQACKVVRELVVTGKLNLRALINLGGMPSSHTAFVTATAVAVGFQDGFASSAFAVGAVVTIIVMVDAAGVRRAAGNQAAAINMIVENLEAQGIALDKKLKELLGHTPAQVAAGAVLGAAAAVAAVCLGFIQSL